MDNEPFTQALRDALRQDVEQPRHPLATPTCLGLPDLAPSTPRAAWSDDQRQHAASCNYCQRMIGIGWRIKCPSHWQLVRYVADPDTYQDAVAMQFHVANDDCDRCKDVLASPIFQRLALAVRALLSVRGNSVAIAGMGQILQPAGLFASAGPTPAHYSAHQSSVESPLTATISEHDGGRLAVLVESQDRALAGRRVRLELFGLEESIVEHLEMRDLGEFGSSARLELGRLQDVVQKIGASYGLLAVLED